MAVQPIIMITSAVNLRVRRLRAPWLGLICLLMPFLSLGQRTTRDLLDAGFQEEGHKAIRLFTQALAQDSTSAEAYWRRGNVYYRLKKYTLALADLQHSLRVDSTFSYGQVISDRGQTYEMLHDYLAAIRDFTHAITYATAQNPSLPQGLEQYYYHRGRTSLKNRDTTAALVDLDSALHHYQRHYDARTLRARIYCQRGSYQAALADYTYLFRQAYPDQDFPLEPESAADFYYRGIAKQHVGDSTYQRDLAIAKRFRYYPSKPTYNKDL